MKRKIFCVLVLLLCSICVYSQQPQPSPTSADTNNEWFRVRSDDGDFSIEIPAKYSYFYDKDGISFSESSNTYMLKKMQMINAFHENTLVSVESYETGKDALKGLFESDKFYPKERVVSDFKRDKTQINQLVVKTEDYYCVRQYFASKNRIYILTAASRNGETVVLKKFLESLTLTSDEQEIKDDKAVLFSTLKQSFINITTKKNKNKTIKKTNENKESEDKISTLLIVRKPRPSYTMAARMNGVQGDIQLRLKFDENGYIPEINIVEDLPKGLMRQAVFAAIRMKFLPEMANDKPRAVVKIVQFTFTIY